ncbi:MAG: glycosyltransferase, partial [Candidatus Thiodiazotropha lotti]
MCSAETAVKPGLALSPLLQNSVENGIIAGDFKIELPHFTCRDTMEFVLWGSFLLVFYAYFGYPFLLMAINRVSRAIDYKSLQYPENLSVTLIIPVHNEEAVIARKLDNTNALNFSGNLEVLIVSDGSSDKTVQIVKDYQGIANLSLIELEERKGKANALNSGLQAA